MKTYIKHSILLVLLVIATQSCVNDLDTIPLDNDIVTSGNVFSDPSAYRQVLAKLYAGLAVSGQQGPAGNSDIGGIDEGFGQYLRGLWYHQELPTDEAVIGWNDQTISDYHEMDWTSGDTFIAAFYSRIFYQISLCNEFIRQTEDDVLDDREVDDVLRADIAQYRSEARFLRALSYYHAIDHFRNVPFVTEQDAVGAFLPEQADANAIFQYIESELLAIEPAIIGARQNEYSRADQGAVWMLLAKLYLNAESYINIDRYADALTYAQQIIDAGYTLEPEYAHLFLADNHRSQEIIFPVAFDGINTRTWGGMTFIIRAGLGGDIDPAASGVVGGWGGTRTTPQIVNKFGDIGGLISKFAPKTNLPQIYVAGDHQGNVIDGNYAINSINSNRIHEGFQFFSEPNNSFVIAPNPTLSLVYGDNGADGTLEIGGDRIVTPEAGLYYFYFDMNTRTYELEKVTLKAVGSAIGSQNIEFTYDPETRLASAAFDLSPGEFSIMIDGADRILGDANGDGYLTFTEGASQISYTEPVEVTLNISKQAFTYQVGSTSFDRRGIFDNTGQTLEIGSIAEFTEGYAVTKFKNVTSEGVQGSDTDFPDTDFPMFRLGDVYLMAAEAILRTSGDQNLAAQYINEVRRRAYKGSGGDIQASDATLDFLIEERARELYWECHRRSDLVRFGLLTTGEYLWAWKGGVAEGQAVEQFRRVYPIPSSDLNANPNLKQNEGY